MAGSSNRSPSPLPVRHPPPARRSFSGSPSPKPFPLTNPRRSFNPITPANSPADSGRRVLPGKEDIASSWDYAEKENEKAAKLRSPAKGSKNFMSPTISAASKICPSPKKKVLVDRNEPVRSSIALCDGKATFFSSISSEATEYSKPNEDVLQGPPVAKTLKRVKFAKVPLYCDNASDSLSETAVKDSDCFNTETCSKNMRRVKFAEVPLHCDNASDSLSETVVIDSDCFNTETCSKNINSCSTLSPSTTTIAPLDADPSLSPYDPKTNYLSPRPQFLHYRPNPRIEVLRSMDKGVDMGEPRQLDDSFVSEIVSENSDSEAQIEDSSSTETEIVVEPVVEETEVVEELKSSEEEVVVELETEETEVVEKFKSLEEEIVLEQETDETEMVEELDSELSLPVSTSAADEMAKEIPDVQKQRKPRFFIHSKLASTILLLVIACVSVSLTDSPVLNGYGVKDLKLTNLSSLGSQISVLVQSTLNDHFKGGSDFSSLITDDLGPMRFIDLTADPKGGSKWELEEDREFKELEENLEEDELDNDVEPEKMVKEVEEDEVEEDVDSDVEGTEGDDDTSFGDSSEMEFGEKLEFEDEVEEDTGHSAEAEEDELEFEDEVEEDVGSAEAEASEGEVYTDFGGDNNEMESEENLVLEVEGDNSRGNQKQELIASGYDSVNADDLVAAALQDFDIKTEAMPTDVQPEVVEVVKFQGDDNANSHTQLETTLLDANLESTIDNSCVEEPSSSEMLVSPIQIQERSFTMLGISSFLLGAVAVAVGTFVFLKQKNVTPDYVVPADPCLPKRSHHLVSASAKHIGQEKQSSEDWQTEADVVAESCPSEMSSFEVSTSYSRKDVMLQTSRAHRQDRKPDKSSSTRGESVAASSDYSLGSPSPSYGSFTTYERIPIKHGSGGGEEVMTPVRRSSRIRSQVTSP